MRIQKQSFTPRCYIKTHNSFFITLSSKKVPLIAREKSEILHLSTEDLIQPKIR
jgi:hypothetical protein